MDDRPDMRRHADDPAGALDAMLASVREALAGGASQPPAGPFPGEALDGRVRAEVGADGRLASLELDPTLLRMPLEDIAVGVMGAVNAALDARPAGPGTAALRQHLEAVQTETVQQMARITAAFSDALAQAQRR